MSNNLLPLSINLHITQSCNMSCHACFADYGEHIELGFQGWLSTLDLIAAETEGNYKVKITFAGGEPTLIGFLPELVFHAKNLGMSTGIITNGSLLDEHCLDRFADTLDWVGISIDSIDSDRNERLGRHVNGQVIKPEAYLSICRAIKDRGLKLKVNTVVSKLNQMEDFSQFIIATQPDRWKVMQLLLVSGQNDSAKVIAVTSHDFDSFVQRHQWYPGIVVEKSESMLCSYAMVDPSGRPYGNGSGIVRFGTPVSSGGFLKQLDALGYKREMTERRGGFY